ncbi:MAG: type II toxin-antitoxin system RelE/ParE family toxin [Oscillospiraceae bacterium]|nr:type II toxin-antitoxin system RelE/ParE family toxin [Oscillospiraceae bacterium]
MDFRVEFTAKAKRELDSIVAYISDDLDNYIAAERLYNKMVQTINVIGGNPYLFALCYDDKLSVHGYRRAIVDDFLILFAVDEEKKFVSIEKIVYGKRNLDMIM